MTIKLDQDTCIGCGMCQSLCEKCFQLNDETGKAEAVKQDCEGDNCNLQDVESSCPVGAIKIED